MVTLQHPQTIEVLVAVVQVVQVQMVVVVVLVRVVQVGKHLQIFQHLILDILV